MKQLFFIGLIFLSLGSIAQKVPQHVNTWYDFWGVSIDSLFRLPWVAPRTIYRDTGTLYFNRADRVLHWWTGDNDTTFVPGGGGNGNVYRFNILNSAAVRDSTVDNTAHIQQAIDSCHNSGGGVVYFPNGVWLSGKLHSYSNVEILGEGQGTIIKAKPGTDTMFVQWENTFVRSNVTLGFSPVQDIVFNCNSVAAVGLAFKLRYWFAIRNVQVYYATSYGMYTKGCLTGQFDNFMTYGGPNGIYLDSTNISGGVAPNLLQFNNCRFYFHPNLAVTIRETQGLPQFNNCDWENNGTSHNVATGNIASIGSEASGPTLSLYNCWMEACLGTLVKSSGAHGATELVLIHCNLFQNIGASVGLDVSGNTVLVKVALIATTLLNDSLDLKGDAFSIVSIMSSQVGTRYMGGIPTQYLVKDLSYTGLAAGSYPLAVGLVSTSGVGVITLKAGSGTGATQSLASWSSTMGGTLTVTAAGTPATNDTLFTVAYEVGIFTAGTIPVINPGNANALDLMTTAGGGFFAKPRAASPFYFDVLNRGAPLVAGQQYTFHWHLVGK